MFKVKDDFMIQVNNNHVCQVSICRISDSTIYTMETIKTQLEHGIVRNDWFLFSTLDIKLVQKIAEWFVINTPLCYKATVALNEHCKATYIDSDKLPG